MHKLKKYNHVDKKGCKHFSGCDTVGREVAPDTRVPQFKTSHFYVMFTCIEEAE